MLNQAQRIAYSVTQIDQAFTRYYPQGYSGSPSNTQLIGDAQTRWTNALAGYQDALHVQAGVVGNITATQSQITGLVTASQGASGALQASQSGNQLLAVIARELADVTALLAAQGRAASLAWRRDDRQPGAGSVPDHHLPDHGRGLPAAARHDVPLMRRPALNARSLGRTGAVLLVAGAISAAAISIHSADRSRAHAAATAASSRAINAGLERCRDLGTAAENDRRMSGHVGAASPPLLRVQAPGWGPGHEHGRCRHLPERLHPVHRQWVRPAGRRGGVPVLHAWWSST